MYTDLGPAQITYYIQIKHAFWKTSRISWLWGAFVTVDTLWFRFVWKDVIAFHVLILLTGWHRGISHIHWGTSASCSTLKVLPKPCLTFQKAFSGQNGIPAFSLAEALWIFPFVRLYSSWVLGQCALRCLNRSDNTEVNKSSWSSVTSVCHITLVLHSTSACVSQVHQIYSLL